MKNEAQLPCKLTRLFEDESLNSNAIRPKKWTARRVDTLMDTKIFSKVLQSINSAAVILSVEVL